MSKFLKVMIVLLTIALFASAAIASELTVKGFYQVRGISYNNLDGTDTTDDNANGIDQRVRLYFNGSANENVKGVFVTEVDNVWGYAGAVDKDTGKPVKEVGRVGADAKGQIEIKHAYLDVTLPDYSVNFKAGTQGFNQANGLIIDDDAAGLKVARKFGDIEVNFMWVKIEENSIYDDAADMDYYTVQAALKAGSFKLVPLVGYVNQSSTDFTNLYLGAKAEGKVAMLGLSLNAVLVIGNKEMMTGPVSQLPPKPLSI